MKAAFGVTGSPASLQSKDHLLFDITDRAPFLTRL